MRLPGVFEGNVGWGEDLGSEHVPLQDINPAPRNAACAPLVQSS